MTLGTLEQYDLLGALDFLAAHGLPGPLTDAFAWLALRVGAHYLRRQPDRHHEAYPLHPDDYNARVVAWFEEHLA